MSAREDLLAARALIDTPEKWLKGEDHCRGSYCLTGALEKVVGWTGPFCPVEAHLRFDAAISLLREHTDFGDRVFKWNDRPETTHADVLAAIDLAVGT